MKKRLLFILLLISYCVVLIRVMVFKVVPVITSGHVILDFGGTNADHQANLVPFATILPYLFGGNGLTIGFLNLAGNIALLVPLGFLISNIFRKLTWKKALAFGALTGFSIEIMQSILRVGVFDIDDVILNALGVIVGHLSFVILSRWLREKKYIHLMIAALLFVAVIIGSFYIVYPDGSRPVITKTGAGGQFDQQEKTVPEQGDLCGGTGGTGQIISVGKSTITIQGRKESAQVIKLTEGTTIRTSAGPASETDLKIGDRITVVIDDTETASTVLVCN